MRFLWQILVDLPPGGRWNLLPRKLPQSCLPRRSTNFVIVSRVFFIPLCSVFDHSQCYQRASSIFCNFFFPFFHSAFALNVRRNTHRMCRVQIDWQVIPRAKISRKGVEFSCRSLRSREKSRARKFCQARWIFANVEQGWSTRIYWFRNYY